MDFFIFLCGGSSEIQSDLRRKVGGEIASTRSKYRYAVYYPEDMFVELILGHARRDLLSLENMLAESVHAVAILLDGAGTFAELGAFANHQRLKEKLILIVDPRYGRSKSFINLGPLRYLRKETNSKVHHIPLATEHIGEMANAITDSVRQVAKHSPPTEDLTNPICAHDFYLATVFVFDPIPRDSAISIGRTLVTGDQTRAMNAAETVINILVNHGYVTCAGGCLSCTKRGIDYLMYASSTKSHAQYAKHQLTKARYEALNQLYRRKVGTKGGAFDI